LQKKSRVWQNEAILNRHTGNGGDTGMKQIALRMATMQDAVSILNIYRPYIENSAITFETELPALQKFKKRIAAIMAKYPYIVCCINNKIVGYAYAHRYRERAAYQWNAELSIYMQEDFSGRKIGAALYHALIKILQLQHIQNVYGCITTPNPASEKFHRDFGFSLVGICRKVGYKCGQWQDVAWYEKFIGIHANPPVPPLSVNEISPDILVSILRECESLPIQTK
jgi:phosphinothricin acetyltransferase